MAMEEIVARLGLDNSRFTRGINQAQNAVYQVKRALGGIGLTLGSAALIGFFRRASEEIDRTAKLARQLNFDFEELQGLQFGASQQGVATEQLNKALEQLTRRAGEAAARGGEMAQNFQRFGISLKDANGQTKDTTTLLFEVADRIAATSSATEQAAIATAFFEESGGKLLNLLRGGSAVLKGYTDQARELGLITTNETAASIELMNDRIAVLEKRGIVTLGNVLGFFIQIGDAAASAAKMVDELAQSVGKIIPAVRLGRFTTFGLVTRMVAGSGNAAKEVEQAGAVRRANEEQPGKVDTVLTNLEIAAAKKAADDLKRTWEKIAETRKRNAFELLNLEEQIADVEREIALRSQYAPRPGTDDLGTAQNLLEIEELRGKLAKLREQADAKRAADAKQEAEDAKKAAEAEASLQEQIADLAKDRAAFLREQKPLNEQIREVEREILDLQRRQNDAKASGDPRVDEGLEWLAMQRELLGLLDRQRQLRDEQTNRLGRTVEEIAVSVGSGPMRGDTSGLASRARSILRRQEQSRDLFGQAARERARAEKLEESPSARSANIQREIRERRQRAEELEGRARGMDEQIRQDRTRLPGVKETEKGGELTDEKLKQQVAAFLEREGKSGIKVERLSSK